MILLPVVKIIKKSRMLQNILFPDSSFSYELVLYGVKQMIKLTSNEFSYRLPGTYFTILAKVVHYSKSVCI